MIGFAIIVYGSCGTLFFSPTLGENYFLAVSEFWFFFKSYFCEICAHNGEFCLLTVKFRKNPKEIVYHYWLWDVSKYQISPKLKSKRRHLMWLFDHRLNSARHYAYLIIDYLDHRLWIIVRNSSKTSHPSLLLSKVLSLRLMYPRVWFVLRRYLPCREIHAYAPRLFFEI